MIFIRALILIVIFVSFTKAQVLFPDASWKTHFNLQDIKRLQFYNDKIYCFGTKGFYSFDLVEKKKTMTLRKYNPFILEERITFGKLKPLVQLETSTQNL